MYCLTKTMPKKGEKMSEEHKRKIGLANSIALKGKKQSEESRRKKSLALRGKKFDTHKGMLGKKHSEETKRKISEAQKGKKCKNWKGENAKHSAIHEWVRKEKGTPSYCEHCKSTTKKKYEWANIDHKYTRNLDDYIRLCTSCHCKYDIIQKKLRKDNYN